MKHPFWLINDLLLMIFFMIVSFIITFQPSIPRRVSLQPESEIKLGKKDISRLDLSKIYQNDLFDTVQTMESSFTPFPKPSAVSMPPPPLPQPVRVPLATPPKFLEPLQITLKGIISLSNESENIAIIQDNKTSSAKNYSVGERIEDAQIIRILRHKIILIRSNGQQETLYVNPYDAENERQRTMQQNWSTVVQYKDTVYLIDPLAFVKYVSSLSEFIDVFNLTTEYKAGQNIGCRIGKLAPTSLAMALGLQPGDIIIKINDIPTTTTDNRFAVYQKIINMSLGDFIHVHIMRKQQEIFLEYRLQTLDTHEPPSSLPPGALVVTKDPAEQLAEKKALLQKQHHFAPTMQELQKQEQHQLQQFQARRNKNMVMNAIPSRM